ncbi:protein FAR-RED IMPAIRED RESPONSE 1-like [Chenopodium quinoa]|uniref:protein FAR-RED IMPAIRED RESPONSE 1-like n=1 Tax=Chenopodium quinoa TaxID=63459 RepID=UPI000B799FB4|nr:protein FAR-RED IMPAIRED RESPONSE 1-like [Chenopodium quinoa]
MLQIEQYIAGAVMDCGFESGEMGEPVGISYSDEGGGGQVISSGGVPDGLPFLNCIPNSAERLAALSPIKTIETVETIVSTNQICMYTYVESPRLGMVFKSFEDVESYYKEYAEQKGFGVTRVASTFSKKDKERRGATWRCECWGPPDMRARREAKKRAKVMELCGTGGIVNGEIGEDIMQRVKRTSKKCECGAMLYAGVDSDALWVIRKLKNEHDNHTPKLSDAKLVKEYRMKNCTSNVKKKLFNFYEEGVYVRQIHGCMATETGADNLPSVKDLEHEVSKEKRLKMEGGDAAAMMAYFDRMQEDNQNFYHAHRLDEEGRLKDVLWVDACSRVAYEDFGDVVCFDATYLTNAYALPFANFVGVNHHGQSILLGYTLVSHEDCDTFGWIFRKWLSCMGNKQPGAILTDQAAAMRKPLAQVMPNARHRCYHDFKSPLKAVVYESFTVAEFERRWTDLIKQFELEDNDWLADLFEERHMWVPAFMKEHFLAGMKTTQRVESINSFFDGFVNRKTRLYEFPNKYTRAMGRRVKAETDADARCGKYLR